MEGNRSTLDLALQGVIIGAPVIGAIGALWLWGSHGIGWIEVALFLVFYAITGLGITTGFHRLLTHRSFKATPALRYSLAIAGSMSAQEPLFWWVAEHRQHHQVADAPGDPHSPYYRAEEELGTLHGLWHAHVGWLFKPRPPELMRLIPDLTADRGLVWIDRLSVLWILIGLALPAAIGGLAHGSWAGAGLGLLWGGLVRMFVVNHVTWSVNSICHTYGKRDFRSPDRSTNQPVVAILAIGEGWHNNHHAFPRSARHGLLPGQIDPTYWLILGLEKLGWVAEIQLPSSNALAARRLR